MNRTLRIEIDLDPQCPMEFDQTWTLISFNRNSLHHGNLRSYIDSKMVPDPDDPDEEIEVEELDLETQQKLENGLAFFLYKSNDDYEIVGLNEIPDDWQDARDGGFLIFGHEEDMGHETPELRQKDAQCFLDEYNAWANGHVYGFILEDQYENQLHSCWGFYDFEQMVEHFNDLHAGDELVVHDESQCVFDAKVLEAKIPGVKVVTEFSGNDPSSDELVFKEILDAMRMHPRLWSDQFIPVLEARLSHITFPLAEENNHD